MVSLLNIRGRRDHVAAPDVDPQTSEDTKSPPNVAQDAYNSGSDANSLEAINEKEIQEHPDQVTGNVELGVQKVEAAALVWSRKAVYCTYVWYVCVS